MLFMLQSLDTIKFKIDLFDPIVRSMSRFQHFKMKYPLNTPCKPGLAILCGESFRESYCFLSFILLSD